MKTAHQQALLYCLLFLLTHFVNKFVLSVLKFQFPTIFQGWQTLVGFLMLSLLIAAKHLPQMMEDVPRSDIAHWLPGMICFVCSIYSGSKALAKLESRQREPQSGVWIQRTWSMPVFLSLHSLVTVIMCTGQLALYRQLTSLFSYAMIMLLVVSSICIGYTDPDFDPDGYYWMCVHILSSGALGIYTKLMRGRLKMSAHERLYCNYLYSVIVLAPSSYFLGDAVEAGKFPYLYFSKFYMGCIMSGVFGVFLTLSNIRLVETASDKAEFSKINGLSKLVASLVSLACFEMTITANHLLWILVNCLAAIVCEDSANVEETKLASYSQASNGLQKQNTLTHEFIRVSVE